MQIPALWPGLCRDDTQGGAADGGGGCAPQYPTPCIVLSVCLVGMYQICNQGPEFGKHPPPWCWTGLVSHVSVGVWALDWDKLSLNPGVHCKMELSVRLGLVIILTSASIQSIIVEDTMCVRHVSRSWRQRW